jgi:uncharacterized repeat protein (TIGR01451 family)
MIALAALATTSAGRAAQADVTVALTAHRVIQKDGREALVSGDQAFPGEVLEYRATYRNAGDAGVQKLAATLPIPGGMQLIANTASPRGVLGSLDGKTFAALPLHRKVKLENGREVRVEVPASEIRFLRWAIPALAANAERSVSARVRVTPVPVAAQVRH